MKKLLLFNFIVFLFSTSSAFAMNAYEHNGPNVNELDVLIDTTDLENWSIGLTNAVVYVYEPSSFTPCTTIDVGGGYGDNITTTADRSESLPFEISSNTPNGTCDITETGTWTFWVNEALGYNYNTVGDYFYNYVEPVNYGCTYPSATNFDVSANRDDNTCMFDLTASSTAQISENLGSLNFGLAIIITLMSLGFVGYIYNGISKKRKWQ